MKRVTLMLDEALWRRVKMEALSDSLTASAFVEKLIADHLWNQGVVDRALAREGATISDITDPPEIPGTPLPNFVEDL